MYASAAPSSILACLAIMAYAVFMLFIANNMLAN
jgi:hypothetical protein